jgi:hypothetical protein
MSPEPLAAASAASCGDAAIYARLDQGGWRANRGSSPHHPGGRACTPSQATCPRVSSASGADGELRVPPSEGTRLLGQLVASVTRTAPLVLRHSVASGTPSRPLCDRARVTKMRQALGGPATSGVSARDRRGRHLLSSSVIRPFITRSPWDPSGCQVEGRSYSTRYVWDGPPCQVVVALLPPEPVLYAQSDRPVR